MSVHCFYFSRTRGTIALTVLCYGLVQNLEPFHTRKKKEKHRKKNSKKVVLISNLCTLGRSNFHSRATVLVSNEI